MDKFNSNINYTKFEDQDDSLYMSIEEDNLNYAAENNNIEHESNDSKFKSSVNRNINESSTFRSINLDDPNNHNIWSPNFDNSWNIRHPKKKSYYDTDKMSDSIDDTKETIKKNLVNVNERKSNLNKIQSISEMLDTNSAKFQSKNKKLKYERFTKYAFHSIFILLMILFIVTLIVILVKS